MTFTLRLYDRDGTTLLGLLPESGASLTAGFEFSNVGALSLTYPKAGVNAGLLAELREIALCDASGAEVKGGRFVITGVAQNRTESTSVQVTAKSILWRSSKALVYPAGGFATTGGGVRNFQTVNPGSIVKTLFDEAVARGALAGMTIDFTASVDSVGTAWPTTISRQFNVGDQLLNVILQLVDEGLLEVQTQGRVLRAFVPTAGTQKASILRHGANLTEAPEDTSAESVAGVALVRGESGLLQERTNGTTTATYGRLEDAVNASGVTDAGTMQTVGDKYLQTTNTVGRSLTVGLKVVTGDGNVPLVDFHVGDLVNTATTAGLEQVRVRQIGLVISGAQESASVVLNDLFLENDLVLSRAIQGLTGGSPALTPPPSTPASVLAPSTPGGVTATSSQYFDAYGNPNAQVTVSWAAVLTNTDGSTITDLRGYEVFWRTDSGGAPWQYAGFADASATSWSFSPLSPVTFYRFTVRAVDAAGNRSGYATEYRFQTAGDTTAPTAGPAPTVTVRLGVAVVAWNGLDNAGAAVPVDFARCDIHVSTVSNFTPDDTTRKDSLLKAGSVVIQGLTYSATYYARLVLVDKSGNSSTPSTQTSFTVTPLVSTDVIGTVINGSNIVTGSITGNQIQANSVQADRIAAGALSAAITLSGSIKTSGLGTGTPRVEIDGSGVRLYGTGTNPTVNLDSTSGSASFSGSVAISNPLRGILGAASGDLLSMAFTSAGSAVTNLLKFTSDANTLFSVGPSGALSIGATSVPLHLAVGTLQAIGNAQIGDIEFDGSALYLTRAPGGGSTGPVATFTPPSSSTITLAIGAGVPQREVQTTSVTGGSGSGAVFGVTFTNPDFPTAGTGTYASVRLIKGGTGYTATNVLTLSGPWTGGSITVTVNTVTTGTITRQTVVATDGWTAYTPAIGGTGWTVSTATGRYLREGNKVTCEISMKGLGTAGTATMTISLPIVLSASALRLPIHGMLLAAGATPYDLRAQAAPGSGTIAVYVMTAAYSKGQWLGFTNANSPVALGGTGGTDEVLFTFVYEV